MTILDGSIFKSTIVMPALVAGIHDFIEIIMPFKSWMAGTSPAMTAVDDAMLPSKIVML